MRLGEQKGAENLPFHPLQLFPLPPQLLTDRQQTKKEITDNSLFSVRAFPIYVARKKKNKVRMFEPPTCGSTKCGLSSHLSLAVTYYRWKEGKTLQGRKIQIFFSFCYRMLEFEGRDWTASLFSLFSRLKMPKCKWHPPSCGYGGKRCLRPFPRKKEMPAAPENYSFFWGGMITWANTLFSNRHRKKL